MSNPTKGDAFTFELLMKTESDLFANDPPIASGDAKVFKDGGAAANVASLPTLTQAGEPYLTVALSETEMDADRVMVKLVDQSDPKAWADVSVTIQTVAPAATEAKQDEIKAALAARAVSMNDDLVPTELNLIHFDTYDGVMHPKRSWETEKDYSDPEWAIKLLITDLDVTTVLKQVDGEAESAVLVSIPSLTVEFESEIEFLGCPPIAGLGFAVVAIKDGKYETIAKGECNVENRGEVT